MDDTQADRDDHGRFIPGHTVRSIGGGRPRSEVTTKINAALEAAVGRESLQKWAAAVLERMEKGDLVAAEFVFDRLIGKPIARTEQRIELGALLEAWASGNTSATTPPESNAPSTNTLPD